MSKTPKSEFFLKIGIKTADAMHKRASNGVKIQKKRKESRLVYELLSLPLFVRFYVIRSSSRVQLRNRLDY
jgi:hypothetical protein